MYKPYVDFSKPPFIDISLPPAIIIPSLHLIALYTVILAIDFYLLRNEGHLKSVISPMQLRLTMAAIHVLIPLVFISNYPPFNILFASVPWFMATYSAHMPTDQLTIEKYVHALFKVTINDDKDISKTKIRCKGVAKFSLGVFKFAFMHVFINPLLPHHAKDALYYAWSDPMSLLYTVLFGIKAYCMLGFVDIVMGIEQALFAWNMVDLFNSPIIASSPRDFWSRRWNKVVSNLLHAQVFTANIKKKEPEDLNTIAIAITTSTKPGIEQENLINKRSTNPAKQNKINHKITAAPTNNHVTTTKISQSNAVSAVALAAAVEMESTFTTDDDDTLHSTKEELILKDTRNQEINNHDAIVTQANKSEYSNNNGRKSTKTFWSTRRGRGLLSFIISATFHELIIMSACRKITLENFVFFTLQGVACVIEVGLRQGALKQEPQGMTRVLCVALQLLFMSVTGRLFNGPFLRYHFFEENH